MDDNDASASRSDSNDKPKLNHSYGIINKEYAFTLATRPPEEDGPIYMVNLMKYREIAEYDGQESGSAPISGRDADDQYNPSSILNKLGAAIVFVADVERTDVGVDDWDRIAIVRYPTRLSFVEMQSRKDFGEKHKHKAAGMLRTTLIACRPTDSALDEIERPVPTKPHTTVMVVRGGGDGPHTTDSAISTFVAEGTVLSDGRMWDVVDLLHAEKPEHADRIIDQYRGHDPSTTYVLTLRTTLDSVTAAAVKNTK